jgi:hypothetical protein
MSNIRALMERGVPPITNMDVALVLSAVRGRNITQRQVSLMVHGKRKWRPSYILPFLGLLRRRRVPVTLQQLVRLCGMNDRREGGDDERGA